MVSRSIVVAIPARDEEEQIGACLRALNDQTLRPDAVLLLLNNCTDLTASVARSLQLRFPLDVICRDLPPEQANAGNARRLAMATAADRVGPGSVLITSDADAVAPPDWIQRNISAINAGADIVCGRAVIDPADAAKIPAHLHEDDAREVQLIGLLDDLAWALDPELHDPPPRHTEASGASLAVTIEAFMRAGGIPAIRSGEDRAFVRALWMIDAKVRHDPAIAVMVSGRIEGRAEGGMADAIRRRMVLQDEFTDEQVEPAADAFRRYALRRRVRRVHAGAADRSLARDLKLSDGRLAWALTRRHFGVGWAQLEAVSPVLNRARVRFADVAAEIASARELLNEVVLPETMAAD